MAKTFKKQILNIYVVPVIMLFLFPNCHDCTGKFKYNTTSGHKFNYDCSADYTKLSKKEIINFFRHRSMPDVTPKVIHLNGIDSSFFEITSTPVPKEWSHDKFVIFIQNNLKNIHIINPDAVILTNKITQLGDFECWLLEVNKRYYPNDYDLLYYINLGSEVIIFDYHTSNKTKHTVKIAKTIMESIDNC